MRQNQTRARIQKDCLMLAPLKKWNRSFFPHKKRIFELKAVSRTTKPRCKVHWVRSEPCLSNPSAPGRSLPVRTIAQSVRRPGIEPGDSIVTEAGYAAKHSCQQATNQLRYRAEVNLHGK
jgi:hypothetical protein